MTIFINADQIEVANQPLGGRRLALSTARGGYDFVKFENDRQIDDLIEALKMLKEKP